MLCLALRLVAALSLFALALALLAALHPALDAFRLTAPLFCLGALPALWLFRPWSLRIAALALVGWSCAGLLLSLPAAAPSGDLRIYTKNLHARHITPRALGADILNSGAEIVMLQEVAEKTSTVLADLSGTYPHQRICGFTWRQTAILSKTPFRDTLPCASHTFAAVQLNRAGQTYWAVSAHTPWHWPLRTGRGHVPLLEALKQIDGPVVIAGDFNSFPWTDRMQAIARTSRTRMAGPLRATLAHRAIPVALPIDFALAPAGGTTQRRPLLGSDHHGLVADLKLFAPD